jgi:hypothetical protein
VEPVEPDLRPAPLFGMIRRGVEAIVRPLAEVKQATIGPQLRPAIFNRKTTRQIGQSDNFGV